MSWPEAIFYSVAAICSAPVAFVFVCAIFGVELRWRR